MKRPLVWLIGAFTCGIILYFNFSAGLMAAMVGALIYTAAAYGKLLYLILIPALFAGMIPCAVFDHTCLNKPTEFDGQTVSMTFVVKEASQSSGRYKIETEKINGKVFKTTGYLYSKTADYKLFDRAEASASFTAVKNLSKSNAFDYKTYLINKGVFFTAYEYGKSNTRSKASPGVIGRISLLREAVLTRTREFSTAKNYGVFSAILTGEKSELSEITKNAFSRLGISHLLAVSGLHISIILAMISAVLGFFKVRPLPKAIICTLFLLGIIPFMNSSPSVIRAAIMGIILMWSGVIRDDNDSVTSMSVAAFVILLFRPYSIFDGGCILSFTATAGIVLLSPLIDNFFENHFGFHTSTLSVMLAAQTAIIPASIYYCGEFSYISLLANMIFVPLFPILVGLLIITGALYGIFPFLGAILNTTADVYLGAAEQLARLPGIISEVSGVNPIIVLSVVPMLLFFMFGKRMKILFAVIVLVMLSAGGINIYENMNYSHIYFISAEKTNTAVVKTPERVILIAECDSEGGSDYDTESIKAYLGGKGIRKIDEVYFTSGEETSEVFKKELKAEFSPKFPQDNTSKIGGGLTLSSKDGNIRISGKRNIAAFSHRFTDSESCQAAYETATATLGTVFDSKNAISAKGRNIDILFTAEGVKKMEIEN